MKPYEERLVNEYVELENRLIRLGYIIANYDSLDFEPNCSIEILVQQTEAMEKYRDILAKRILVELLKRG